ncbi:hypothetical protein [Pseudopontixanthobacter vadosimaris]|uniref:hypothetical protein n=1 Tax=Pseudopontixanthobacter vadosimaris TaxID=2726450 RepID=UPI0014760DA9|nr:hypothetical protein [Pseudopontixanthobacter vadosimaris]
MARIIAAVLSALLVQGCVADEGVELCQKDLSDKLKAPSTLNVVAAYRGEMPDIDPVVRLENLKRIVARDELRSDQMSTAEWVTFRYMEEIIEVGTEHEMLRTMPVVPSYAILLTYDAENSFGAPLRGHLWCRIANPEEGEAFVFDAVSIDDEEAISDKVLMKEVSLSQLPI